MKRQTVYDFFRENKKSLAQKAKNIVFSNGILKITYPSGFSYELRESDFPNSNLVACYERGEITHFEHDSTSLPATNSNIPEMQVDRRIAAWI